MSGVCVGGGGGVTGRVGVKRGKRDNRREKRDDMRGVQ